MIAEERAALKGRGKFPILFLSQFKQRFFG
jgi:hypothetical protein